MYLHILWQEQCLELHIAEEYITYTLGVTYSAVKQHVQAQYTGEMRGETDRVSCWGLSENFGRCDRLGAMQQEEFQCVSKTATAKQERR